ncbi:MBL fold metallo-hydrolase [Rahnella selenatireducens]|uniref:MBL fold metallo-hydrolase n=1 Tax=Rahnella selenatireducens TaxID=3389797 RepID=UPI0039683649
MNNPFFASRQIGDFTVTALSDGNMAASLDLLSGIETADAAQIQRDAGLAEPGNIHINCYLIRGQGRTILVDSGTGGLNNSGGKFGENLRSAGVAPEDIDTVLLTHAHPDHIGGLLDAQGQPVYPNAEIYIHPLEAEYWRDDSKMMQVAEHRQRNFLLARRMLTAYAAKLKFLDGAEIVKGIRSVWLPGHTPGHSGYRIDSGEQSLLIWGDIVHFPHIQSAQPGVSIAFDCDPVLAENTRKTIMAQAARENLLVAGMHFGEPGFAHILPLTSPDNTVGYHVAYPKS